MNNLAQRHKVFIPAGFWVFLIAGVINIVLADINDPAVEVLKDLKSLQAFESEFIQDVYTRDGELFEKSLGKFYFDGDKQFCNSIESPENITLLSDGEKLWQIDMDLEQVSVHVLKDYLEGSPLELLLNGNMDALKPYLITADRSHESSQVNYYLDAKDEYAPIQKIRLSFVKSKLNYIEIYELSGKTMRLTFSHVKPLKSKKVFRADFPKSYSVVDETSS